MPPRTETKQVSALCSTVQSEPGMEVSEETVTENANFCPGPLPAACSTGHWDI